jgi:hypothetical protein
MAALPTAVKDRITARQTVKVSTLIEMEFATETVRCWLGFGDLVANGHTWKGIGQMVAISGLSQAAQGDAQNATFTMSGVSAPLLAKALDAKNEIPNRPIRVYLQFFDDAWQPEGSLFSVWAGVMDAIVIDRSEGDDGPVRTIQLTAESLFVNRSRPPFGLYSAADQKARYAGDLGCDRVAGFVAGRVARWPVF